MAGSSTVWQQKPCKLSFNAITMLRLLLLLLVLSAAAVPWLLLLLLLICKGNAQGSPQPRQPDNAHQAERHGGRSLVARDEGSAVVTCVVWQSDCSSLQKLAMPSGGGAPLLNRMVRLRLAPSSFLWRLLHKTELHESQTAPKLGRSS